MGENWLTELNRHLRAFDEPPVPANVRIPSAVLIPILTNPKTGEAELLLTKRPETVATHKGQVCFPGGVFEPEDGKLLETALREAEEEVGIRRGDVTVLGRIEPVRTRAEVWILPWVARLASTEFAPNPAEVERLLFLPVRELVEHGLTEVSIQLDTFTIKSPGVWVGGELVWGATAQMLVQLHQVLTGKK